MQLARRAAAGLVAVAALLSVSVPAMAYSPTINTKYGADGVALRSGPQTSAARLGLGYKSQTATLYCRIAGERVNVANRWFYNKNLSTGVKGYSYSEYFGVSGDSLEYC